MKKKEPSTTEEISLRATNKISVRFSEVDSLKVVWHGHYIKYFEEGREAFGAKYGLGYLDVFSHGYVTPVVRSVCEHKSPIHYGDEIEVEARFVNSMAAKLIFHYTIYNKNSGKIAATGETVQVFLDDAGALALTLPDFFADWKRQWGLLKE